jgi:hypothetical protein
LSTASSPPPSLPAVAAGPQLDIGHQQQIDDVYRVVGLSDKDRSPAGNCHDEVPVMNWDFAAIGQVNNEWPKRRGVVQLS